MDEFDFDKLKLLNFDQQKEYIIKYFIPLTNGSHCMLKNGVYEMIPDEVLKSVYFKRIDIKVSQYYFKEYTGVKSVVYEINKPLFFDKNINLCPALPTYKPFKDFSETTKNNARIFLNFMFEILCNKNIAIETHLNKWLSNMCKGNKNDCAIVLKTLSKGVGKSTLPQMIIHHILGKSLSLETGSEPLKNKFNTILGGKLFVSFEELETFSTAEWLAVDSRLKRQITSNMINLQPKGKDEFPANNINNYMLLSNHDIADDDRRFFVLDVQTHRKGDRTYWSNIYDNCFNNEVGNALFAYFKEIDTTGYQAQDYPITKNKLNSISKRLDTVYAFLKDEFILKRKDINSKLSEFYDLYSVYCLSNSKKPCKKEDLTSRLAEIQINYYKSNGFNVFKVKYDTLKAISDKLHWVNELDEYEENENQSYNIVDEIDYKSLYLKQQEELIQLKLQFQELKPNKKKKEVKQVEMTDKDLEKELEKLLK